MMHFFFTTIFQANMQFQPSIDLVNVDWRFRNKFSSSAMIFEFRNIWVIRWQKQLYWNFGFEFLWVFSVDFGS